MINYYQLLDVSENATSAEIKAAYKRKAVAFHPDKNPDTEELFKEINNAYQVLSDPYARSRYDLKLKYGEESFEGYYTSPRRRTNYHQGTPPPYSYNQRKKATRVDYSQVFSKENLKATLFAFLFAVVVGGLVMAGIEAKEYYDEQEYLALLEARRAVFEEAKDEYNLGNYKASLNLLDQLGGSRAGEKDIDQYKSNLISELYQRGELAYQQEKFKEAIHYFSIIEGYPITRTTQHRKILANCYLGNQDYKEGLEILRLMIVNGYKSIDVILRIAEVYKDVIKDYDQALHYYEWGSKIATEEYQAIFGKAFPLIVRASVIPQNHYELYVGLADTYGKTGAHDKAIKAAKWSIEMWPDSIDNYIIRGENALLVNDIKLACKDFKVAKTLNKNLTLPDPCSN